MKPFCILATLAGGRNPNPKALLAELSIMSIAENTCINNLPRIIAVVKKESEAYKSNHIQAVSNALQQAVRKIETEGDDEDTIAEREKGFRSCEGIIEIYNSDPWMAELVEKAKKILENRK